MNKESLRRMAAEADEKSHHATAAELFTRYLRLDPENGFARFSLAENLRVMGLIDQAEKILKTVKDIPAKKRHLFELSWGEIYMDRGCFEIAEKAFRKAVELNPGSTVTWVYLGTCLSKQGRFSEACEILSKGLGAKGEIEEVFLNLGYAKRAAKEYAAARDCFLKALEIDPGYAAAKVALEDIDQCLALIAQD